nr:DUF11 domain-containing protein [Candidatus Dependentiae bacterium]
MKTTSHTLSKSLVAWYFFTLTLLGMLTSTNTFCEHTNTKTSYSKTVTRACIATCSPNACVCFADLQPGTLTNIISDTNGLSSQSQRLIFNQDATFIAAINLQQSGQSQGKVIITPTMPSGFGSNINLLENNGGTAIAWAPSSCLAVGVGTTLNLYAGLTSTPQSTAVTNTTTVSNRINGLDFSCDSHLAAGTTSNNGNTNLYIYDTTQGNPFASPATKIIPATINSVSFSPIRALGIQYIAVGTDTTISGSTLQVYPYTSSSIGSAITPTTTLTGSVKYVAWSPAIYTLSGQETGYIAVGFGNGTINIYQFNYSTQALALVQTISGLSGSGGTVIAWSPDGKYFATDNNGQIFNIYRFDPIVSAATPASLVSSYSALNTGNVAALAWASCDRFGIAETNGGREINSLPRIASPTVDSFSVTTTENNPITIDLSTHIHASAACAGTTPLVQIVTNPTQGTLTPANQDTVPTTNTIFTYTPTPGTPVPAIDNFTYQVIQNSSSGSSCGCSNIGTVTIANNAAPVLTINKAPIGNLIVGQPAQYQLTVTNVGHAPTSGTITVTDTLPSGFTFAATADNGGATAIIGTANGFTAQITGSLAPNGGTAQFFVNVTIAPTATASATNTASASGGGDGTPTVTITSTVTPSANLSVTKTVNPTTIATGASGLTYTFVVTNNGPNQATNVQVTDTDLPAGYTFTSAPSQGTVASGGTGSFVWNVGALVSGANATLTLTGSAPATAGIYQNIVTVTEDEFNPNPSPSATALVTVTATGTPLVISKSALNPFIVGQQGTYRVSVTNISGSDVTGIFVTDTLPIGFTLSPSNQFNNGFTITSTNVSNTTFRALNANTITAGQSLTFDVTVDIAANATPTASNTIGVNTSTVTPTASSVFTDPVQASADLAITKTALTSFVAGQNASYAINVTNNGPSTITSGIITVSDVLPAGLSFVSGTGTGWSVNAVGQVVTATLDTSVNNLTGGGTTSFTITVMVNAAITTANITNTATVTAVPGYNDTATADKTSSAIVTPQAPVLNITKTASSNFIAGQQGTYTIRVTNQGTAPVSGFMVTDTLPANITFVSAAGTGWTVVPFGTNTGFTATYNDSLNGGGAITSDLVITVDIAASIAPNTLTTNTAVVSTSTSMPITTVTTQADLSIVKTANTDQINVGDSLTYTLVLTNNGPSDATNTRVNDTLPTGFVPTSSVVPAGQSVSVAGNLLTWTIGSLAQGASTTLLFSGAAPDGATNGPVSITNTAIATSDAIDTIPANSTSTAITQVNPLAKADLAITKTALTSFVAGQSASYTITIKNNGPSTITSGIITVSDVLPAGLSFVSGTGTGWSVNAVGQVVTATLDTASNNLTGGGTTSFTITVMVNGAITTANITNTATVTAVPGYNDTATADKTSSAIVTPQAPVLNITKTASSNFIAGQQGTYTIKVTN